MLLWKKLYVFVFSSGLQFLTNKKIELGKKTIQPKHKSDNDYEIEDYSMKSENWK